MARRRRYVERTKSLLGSNLYAATNMVQQLATRVAAHTVDLKFTGEQLMAELWEPDAIEACRAAYKYASSQVDRNGYTLDTSVYLNLSYERLKVVPLNQERIQYRWKHSRLGDSLLALRDVYQDFVHVLHVLQWMDTNATAGAARHYWPTILALAPGDENLQSASVLRHTTPTGISQLLPLLRSTATVVSSALLLPDPPPESKRTGSSHFVSIGGYDLRVKLDTGYIAKIETPSWQFAFDSSEQT